MVISVVMPTYNSGKYIGRAIESVLEQTIIKNGDLVELLIVDDSSSDDTCEVVKGFAENIPEELSGRVSIRLLSNEVNLGVAKSRNRGVDEAKGEYVAFLDSDDWWQENKLERQLNVLQNNPDRVLCSTARELFSAKGESTGKVMKVTKEISYKQLLYGNIINCSSVLVRTDVMRRFPMGYDEAHEDYITWLKILKEYGPQCGIDEPLLKYRLSEGGKSRNKLKSAKMQYNSLRYAGFGRIKASFYFLCYAVNGILKYM